MIFSFLRKAQVKIVPKFRKIKKKKIFEIKKKSIQKCIST